VYGEFRARGDVGQADVKFLADLEVAEEKVKLPVLVRCSSWRCMPGGVRVRHCGGLDGVRRVARGRLRAHRPELADLAAAESKVKLAVRLGSAVHGPTACGFDSAKIGQA
jgi:hypothetical protein